jgi:hypothetical protein
MFGQFLVEPDPELELEPDEGVVADVPDVELEPEFPVAVDVVAALATSAPPARSPEVRAPTARTLRRRICMGVQPFCVCATPAPCEPALQTLRPASECSRTARCAGLTSCATNR